MAKDTVINIRTDAATKQAIEDRCAQFGITVSDAVNSFFRQFLLEDSPSFDIRQPRYNKETEEAIQEARDIASGKIPAKPQSVDDFFREMGL